MRRIIGLLLRYAIMLVALLIALGGLSNLLRRRDSEIRLRPFFEQKADFDVLFLGTSHTIDAVYPMELWKDYGIVSYNLGAYGSQIPTSYWILKNALDYTSPQLVVVDCYYLGSEQKASAMFSQVLQAFDAFPLSITKIAAALDLANDSAVNAMIERGEVSETKKRSALDILWDFTVYHERWAEGDRSWFEFETTLQKGAESMVGVATPIPLPKEDDRRTVMREDTTGVVYLRRIIEECKSRGIEVLLTYLPFPAEAEDWQQANRGYEIAAEYGIDYIDFLDINVVNFNTDCYDSRSHLNTSGAKKVTDYLGRFITEHYDIEDRRGDPVYSSWNDDYAAYAHLKAQVLGEQTALDAYLMLLADREYDVLMRITDPSLWQDERYVKLAANLGLDISQLTDGTGFLAVCEGGREAQVIACEPAAPGEYESILGTIGVVVSEDGGIEIWLGEQMCMHMEAFDSTGIRICAINSTSMERIDDAAFTYMLEYRDGRYRLTGTGMRKL